MARELTADDAERIIERLDASHYDRAAWAAQEAWDSGLLTFEVVYQPGDMASYALLFTVLTPALAVLGAPGGGTGDRDPVSQLGSPLDGSHAVMYYAQLNRSLILDRNEFVHPSWIGEQLPELGISGTLALAVLLNKITGHDSWVNRYLDQLRDTGSEKS